MLLPLSLLMYRNEWIVGIPLSHEVCAGEVDRRSKIKHRPTPLAEQHQDVHGLFNFRVPTWFSIRPILKPPFLRLSDACISLHTFRYAFRPNHCFLFK